MLYAACISCAAALDFTGANWIWTAGRAVDGTYPPGNVSFRRDLTVTNGKVPISANILITTDNAYTLYVNGNPVGTGGDWTVAQRYCVPLSHCCNVFAVEGQNYLVNPPNNPAGLLAAIQVRYSDGFADTIVTDAEWHVFNGSVAGFQQVAFDDSQWGPAFVEGPWPTATPWGSSVSVPPEDENPGPSLQSANWIWTNELTGPGSSAHVLIATDNEFTLYINGLLVGSGESFTVANRYVVNFPPTSTVTFAVYAVNTGGPAGVFAAYELVTCDCSSNIYGVTDGSWKFNLSTPAGFIEPGYNDASWGSAVTEGSYSASLWGPTTAPAANSPQSAALPGAPAAPPADVVS
ncbi:hypothetical protein H0H92_003796 [Tricholoma furcatifolium]|nr:hypothetical protein H0H92_003796 [Tricholoma furcatifolium]